MIPDIIYVPYETDSNYISKHYYLGPTPKMENAEYIRKDALLEWLDGKLTIEGATEGYVGGYDSALKDVINKIESL